MSLVRIYGTNDVLAALQQGLQNHAVEMSEVHNATTKSTQLSNMWTSPELLETLKFFTLLLQSSAAGFSIVTSIRSLLKAESSVLLERKDDTRELLLKPDTVDKPIKEFLEDPES